MWWFKGLNTTNPVKRSLVVLIGSYILATS